MYNINMKEGDIYMNGIFHNPSGDRGRRTLTTLEP